MLSVVMLNIIILSVVMLSVIMLKFIMQSVIMLNAIAPNISMVITQADKSTVVYYLWVKGRAIFIANIIIGYEPIHKSFDLAHDK